jgi:hypothetical protein
VTRAAGQFGSIGRTVTTLLLARGLPVCALVRREDERAALRAVDVCRAVRGARRVYFGMSVSSGYLEATVTMAVVAREVGVDALVNMSQMTVPQMSTQRPEGQSFGAVLNRGSSLGARRVGGRGRRLEQLDRGGGEPKQTSSSAPAARSRVVVAVVVHPAAV